MSVKIRPPVDVKAIWEYQTRTLTRINGQPRIDLVGADVDINALLSAVHGSGSWEGAKVEDIWNYPTRTLTPHVFPFTNPASPVDLSNVRVALQSDPLNIIRDAILNDATRFAGGDIAAIKAAIDNLQIEIKFPSAEALDDISTATETATTEREIAVSLPTGATIVRAMLAAFMTAMNNTANAQKIDVKVQGRVSGGTWNTYFSQLDCIGFPAADGATTGIVPLQDVSALVTAAGTYGFRCLITLSSANSVRFTTQYILIVTYRMS